MSKFKHGDKIIISSFYKRRYIKNKCYYETIAIKPITGIYLGTRTLSNGHVVNQSLYDEIDEGLNYVADEYIKALLISPSLTKKSYLCTYK